MVTIDFTTLHYDESYNPSRTSRSICAFSRNLRFQPIVPVMKRTFDPSWVAEQVMVNGKKGRRVGCVIEADKIHYFVFDLDHAESEDDESGMETEVDDSMAVDDDW
jgi:anaphase-promoting complex subunit 4